MSLLDECVPRRRPRDETWNALQIATAEEEVARAESRVTPETRRGMLQALRECVRDTAECSGQCDVHVCPGESHERLVNTIHDPSHLFATRTVPCADWWSSSPCMACTVERYLVGDRSAGRLERSIASIQKHDAAREATGPSISVEHVLWLAARSIMLMQQARALVPASGFSEVIDWAPVSDDGQLKVMLWLKGQGQSLHEADDRVDEANPLRLDEQRFWDYCKRRSAQRASIDLKRQVFMKKIDNTTSAGSTTVTRPAPVPYHAPDQCQVVPWAWNLAKGGGSEATLAVLVSAAHLRQAGEDTSGLDQL